MSRAPKFALSIIGGLFAFLVIGGAGFQWVNMQPWFCNSCHEMNFYYNTWQASTHGASARCLDCHAEPGVRGFIEEKVRGAEQLSAHISGNYVLPIRIIVRVKNNQCLACHAETPTLVDKKVEVRHAVHIDKKVLCADCHSRLVHARPDQARVMQRDQCDSCHKAHTPSLMTGVHLTLNCSQCHIDGKYQKQDSRCEACHKVPPGHISGITTGCVQCHTPGGWKPAKFDHSGFPLVGGHLGLACEKCHPAGRFQGTSPACEFCHQLPPNHLAGVTTGCPLCHSPMGWKPAKFDHSIFPLEGGHLNLACEKCHPSGRFQGTSPACEFCHQLPPNHLAGITTGCSLCHTPMGWIPAHFDHSGFPLTGVHQTLRCDQCHTSGVFRGLSTTCSNCHTPPSTHLGMPADCAQCHTTNGFSPSTYRHAQVGEHVPSGEVHLTCTTCHATRFAQYSCIGSGCHSSNNPQGQ